LEDRRRHAIAGRCIFDVWLRVELLAEGCPPRMALNSPAGREPAQMHAQNL
jgi:hypothetical protein